MTRTEIETAHIKQQRAKWIALDWTDPANKLAWEKLHLLGRMYGRGLRVHLPSSDPDWPHTQAAGR